MKFPKRQLRHLHTELGPQPQFKYALWKKLDTAWDAHHMPAYVWYQTIHFRMSMAVLSGVLIVATVSTSAYAYTSPTVTTGTPLYPIKQQIEKVEEKLQMTPEAKAKFYLKTLQRREAEQKVVEQKAAQKSPTIAQQETIQKTEDQINTVVQKLEKTEVELESASTTEAHELQTKIQVKLERRKQRLEEKESRRRIRLQKFEDAISTSTEFVATSTNRSDDSAHDSQDSEKDRKRVKGLKIEKKEDRQNVIKKLFERQRNRQNQDAPQNEPQGEDE